MNRDIRPIDSNHSISPATSSAFFGRSVEDILSTGFDNTIYSNISHDESKYIIEIPVPGLSRNDVNITLDDNVLWISGERKVKRVFEDIIEFDSKYFRRSFVLPKDADPGKIDASCKHGMLTICVKRLMKDKPSAIRRLKVQGTQDAKVSAWFDRFKELVRGLFKRGA